MSAQGPAAVFRETELQLPEEISLQLEVANVGSRTLAILADISLCGIVLFVVYGLAALFGQGLTGDWLARLSSGALQILLFLVLFGFQWLYFNVFEWLWNGQTPGKKLLHLRVIKVDGTPISGTDVVLRNISRPVDTFPLALVGLVMIFVSRKAQRLGDLMAQTVVIHETPIDWAIFDQLEASPDRASSSLPVAAAVRLAPAQWELLHRYLSRRGQLPPEVRMSLAESLYETLKPLVQGTDLERSTLPREDWLAELARRT